MVSIVQLHLFCYHFPCCMFQYANITKCATMTHKSVHLNYGDTLLGINMTLLCSVYPWRLASFVQKSGLSATLRAEVSSNMNNQRANRSRGRDQCLRRKHLFCYQGRLTDYARKYPTRKQTVPGIRSLLCECP